nr:MAG TPA: hypothetical protein [Caudoviricetes sp.]
MSHDYSWFFCQWCLRFNASSTIHEKPRTRRGLMDAKWMC